MVQHSPTMRIDCDQKRISVNTVKSLLRDEDTLSHLTTVTGDSPAARAAAEGLNAAGLIIDEAHVVDSRTMDIVRDSGASQDQHLAFQISTYGNTEGYGKQDLELGFDIQCGAVEDDGFFFKSYHAPPESSDEDLANSEHWYAANPNLGYTVSERQFEEAYNRAKDNPTEFAGFKQRRLNIWQKAANPMFSEQKWIACGTEIPWKKLSGVGGGVGFDLASSEDWASCAVAWEVDDLLHVWARIWTTEEWIEENEHRTPVSQWTDALCVHEGSAIDFSEVQADIIGILKHTRAGALGFDKTFGIQMGQTISKKFPKLQIGKFSQSVENYAAGTAELVNAVKNGTLRHQNNPAINWQAGHVQAKVMGPWQKPIKPVRDGVEISHLKIDTIQAMVMAIDVKRLAPVRQKLRAGWV